MKQNGAGMAVMHLDERLWVFSCPRRVKDAYWGRSPWHAFALAFSRS